MKTPKPILSLCFVMACSACIAQVQWYQNQDGHNLPPNGTTATSIQPYGPTSFVACYLWQGNDDEFTWKISKSNIAGAEVRTYYTSGTYANVDMRVIKNHDIYLLKKTYPLGSNPEYRIYRLNGNLQLITQQAISFPNNFSIVNLNGFEVDNEGNVYLAGDGQYPDGPGYSPASFVLKTDKNLAKKWSRMDSVATSYTRLHVDPSGKVIVIADYYTSYPDITLLRISSNGRNVSTTVIRPDAQRFDLYSTLDNANNLFIYGDKGVTDTTQGIYVCKVSLYSGHITYRKTLFTAPGVQLNDMRIDNSGRMFMLSSRYDNGPGPSCRISRISTANGHVLWNHMFPFADDSCVLARLVVGNEDRFYAIGQQNCGNYFAKGLAIQMRKDGQMSEKIAAPDSTAWRHVHTLLDGITDYNDQLIAIGNTNDLDTADYSSTYYRAFATRFSAGRNCGRGVNNEGEMIAQEEAGLLPEETTAPITTGETDKTDEVIVTGRTGIYPNPVQDQLTVRTPENSTYDRVSIVDMRGATVSEVKMTGHSVRIDVTRLDAGVYLLVLRSSATLKEETVKFVVRR